MLYWGDLTIGRLTLRETVVVEDKINATTGRRDIVVTGQESNPPLTAAQVRQRREDIMGLFHRLVPIQWTDKPTMNGYYVVSDAGAVMSDYQGEVIKVDWNLALSFIGPANAVDLESRVVSVSRQNDFGLSASAWHAPAGSAYAYYTGDTTPAGSVSRVSSDGTVTVYTGVPSFNPRWGASLTNYGIGRARVLVDSVERVPVGLLINPTSTWEMNNGLTQVTPGSSSTLVIGSWSAAASAWKTKPWNLSVGSSGAPALSASAANAVTVLRNDYEMTTIRVVWSNNPGRVQLDLSLRRGSRFVDGYLQTNSATTLAAWRATAEAGTAPASAAYVTATANDVDGNRYVVISARTFTAQTTQGGLTKSASQFLDFAIGTVVSGSAAVTGDTAADLRNQYLAVLAENVVGVAR